MSLILLFPLRFFLVLLDLWQASCSPCPERQVRDLFLSLLRYIRMAPRVPGTGDMWIFTDTLCTSTQIECSGTGKSSAVEMDRLYLGTG